MAWWYATNRKLNRCLVLTPKVASNSFRKVLGDQARRVPGFDGEYGICVRHPLERFKSAFRCSTTPEHIWRKHGSWAQLMLDLKFHAEIHTHLAPQFDYFRWRTEQPGGTTHARVPRGIRPRDNFEPPFIFVFEEMERDWPRAMEWMGKDPATPMPHEKKRTTSKEIERELEVAENLMDILEEVYADDIVFYEIMRSHAVSQAKRSRVLGAHPEDTDRKRVG